MIVVCRDNNSSVLLEVGKTYFVEKVECVHNQLYYKLAEFDNTLFNYFSFYLISEVRNDKLKQLGI